MVWLMRLSRWARHPPPKGRVLMMLGLLAVIGAIAGLEAFGLWPEALSLDRSPQAPRLPR
ncbi:MAG: hypothetical protein AAFR17_20245 [Pseudomonadota bacterium]